MDSIIKLYINRWNGNLYYHCFFFEYIFINYKFLKIISKLIGKNKKKEILLITRMWWHLNRHKAVWVPLPTKLTRLHWDPNLDFVFESQLVFL